MDLAEGAITVRHTLSELNGRLTLREPKTTKRRRRVDPPKMAVDSLHEHRKRALSAGHLTRGYVFTDTAGNPHRRSHFHRRQFKPLLKRAGLSSVRFHDLRRTAATLLLTQGVHSKVVQERLGHSQIGITLDTYSHVLPTLQREPAAKLDGMLGSRSA